MLTLLVAASLAQAQPGQRLIRADLVRSPRGSNLVLRFAQPIRRDSVPIVPAGRRLVLHLPGPVQNPLAGTREGIGAVQQIQARGRRLTLRLKRLGRAFADRAVVRVRGKTWRLKMSDPSVERDLADVLLGTPRAKEHKPFNALEESAKIAKKTAEAEDAQREPELIQEEPARTAAAGLAAVAAAAQGKTIDPVGGSEGDGAKPPEGLVPPPVKPAGDLAGTVRVVAGVGLVVLGLLGFAFWRRNKTPIQEAFGLKIVSRARLDHKSSIAVLEVGGAVLIVGLSDHGPRLLARLDDGDTMDSGASDHSEAERLRALVGHNPADRLGAWMHAAQSGREAPEEPAKATKAAKAAKAEVSTEPDERVDLRRRLAEIRRTCSD